MFVETGKGLHEIPPNPSEFVAEIQEWLASIDVKLGFPQILPFNQRPMMNESALLSRELPSHLMETETVRHFTFPALARPAAFLCSLLVDTTWEDGIEVVES